MTRPLFTALILFAATVAPVAAQDQRMARTALMGQLDLIVLSVEERLAAGDDLDSARYEMDYAAAMIGAIPWLFLDDAEVGEPADQGNASPAIRDNFADFAALNEQARLAAELAAYSETAEQLQTGFDMMRIMCTSCHDRYTTAGQ